jgi:hypothetical protein
LYKPSFSDNITNWREFEGGKQIMSFLANEEKFKDLFIDDDVFQKILVEHEYVGNSVDKYINTTQTKFHTMLRGVVNLENLFYLREKFKNPKNAKTSSSCHAYEVINLGIVNNPRNINLTKSLSPDVRSSAT